MSNQNYNENVAPPPKVTPDELRRKVTAPIPPESMREYFSDKEILFVVNYKKSTLKGPVFLMYLVNLAMPVDVEVNLTDYAEYSELMKAYFGHPGVVDSMSLAALAGELVMHFTRVPKEHRPVNTPVSEEFLERFCSENEDTLATWCVFLDSMVTYIAKKLLPKFGEEEGDVPVVDQMDVIGQNVVNLLRFPEFLSLYLAGSELKSQIYFKRQFDDSIYGGRPLAYYFLCESNSVNLVLSKQTAEPILTNVVKLAEHLQQHAKQVKE